MDIRRAWGTLRATAAGVWYAVRAWHQHLLRLHAQEHPALRGETAFLYLDGALLTELTRSEVWFSCGRVTVSGHMPFTTNSAEAATLLRHTETGEVVTVKVLLVGRELAWTSRGRIIDATVKSGLGVDSELEFSFVGDIER